MRVGIDGYPLTTWGGGIQRYTANLLRALARADGAAQYRLYRGGDYRIDADAISRPTQRYPLQRLLDHVFLPGLGRDVDLYHGTNYFTPLRCEVPSVITVHDMSVQLFPQQHPATRRIQHKLLPLMCRRSASVIADSEHTKRDLLRLIDLPETRVEVIPLAVDKSFQRVTQPAPLAALRRRYRLPERFLLYVGALEARKNLTQLVRALALQAKHGPQLPMLLAGKGESRYVEALLRQCAAGGLEPGRDVRLLGLVPEGDLPGLYSLCHAFLYPSSYEGFGLPPLEAMACGAPVLVAANSSLSEIYSDCALVADGRSARDLQGKLAELLEDAALRARLSELGRRQARRRSWDNVAAETLAVYRKALGSA